MTRRSREPDGVLLSVGWGGLWAAALGVWLLAPAVIATHHLHPQGVADWLALTIGLTLLFSVGGMFLGFLGGFVPVIAETINGRQFSHRAWAYGLSLGPVLVVAYVLENVLIHQMAFGTLKGMLVYQREITTVSIALSVASIVLIWIYRTLVPRYQLGASVLAWTLCGATVAGTAALIPRLMASHPQVTVALERARVGEDVPLLFIGLDGATWRVLQPAMANGSAPTFKRLVEAGTHGTVDALWPPYWSSAAWASVVTGLPQEVTGVYEDLSGAGVGLPTFQIPLDPTLRLSPLFLLRSALLNAGVVRFTPPPRDVLNGKPVWQLLHEAGVHTAVMRFRFTYPPANEGGIVVSDWAGHDEWEAMGVRREMGADTVTPASRADELLAPFRREASPNPALFSTLLPGPVPEKPVDFFDPIEALRVAADIDDRTFVASEEIVRQNPAQPFFAVYLGGLDSVEHAFWPYRFPNDFPRDPPTAKDVDWLGPVVDRYVQYVDERLGRLLSLYDVPPNVVIVSDHGHGATVFKTGWKGWHTKDGVFLAAGPSIAQRSAPIKVSYYDLLPTLVGLKGFRVSQGANGRSVVTTPVTPQLD